MKNKTLYFLSLTFLISLFSCTITKRHYNPGYSIQWSKHIHRDNLVLKETCTSEASTEQQATQTQAEIIALPISLVPAPSIALQSRSTSELTPSNSTLVKNTQPVEVSDSTRVLTEEEEMQKSADKFVTTTHLLLILIGLFTVLFTLLAGPVGLLLSLLLILIASITLTSQAKNFKIDYKRFKDHESYKKVVHTNIINQVLLILTLITAAILIAGVIVWIAWVLG